MNRLSAGLIRVRINPASTEIKPREAGLSRQRIGPATTGSSRARPA
jgi:hypothetical protein